MHLRGRDGGRKCVMAFVVFSQMLPSTGRETMVGVVPFLHHGLRPAPALGL